MAEIALEAGMSSAALYYHFANKDDLFAAAVDLIAHRIESATVDREQQDHQPLLTADAVETVWQWSEEHRDEAQILYSWAASGPPQARLIRRDFVDFYRRKASERIAARAASPHDDLTDRLAGRTYVGLSMSMSEKWISGEGIAGTMDRRQIVETLVRVSSRLTGVS